MSRLAIWIARRALVAAGLRASRVEVLRRSARAAGIPVAQALRDALVSITGEYHASDIRLVLSCGDVACADCFEVPFRNEGEIETVAASLTESRCAGETAEELAITLRRVAPSKDGSRVHALAMTHSTLSELRDIIKESLPRANLTLVTATLPLMAESIVPESACVLNVKPAGEIVGLRFERGLAVEWAALPCGISAENSKEFVSRFGQTTESLPKEVQLRNQRTVPIEDAVIHAALTCNAARVLNLLSAAADVKQAHAGRLRSAWLRCGVAAIFLLGAAGFYFDASARRASEALSTLEAKEKALWITHFPDQPYVAGALQASMNKALADHAKGEGANQFPSALGFWREVATHLPNPDQVGLSIESIQFGHDGGRLLGRVDKANDDILKNASLLEAHLNRSRVVQARGEFETRDKEIVVRLRMDYQPQNPSAEGLR